MFNHVKRSKENEQEKVKTFIIVLYPILTLSLFGGAVKSESLGGRGGGGYYIKLFEFPKVCPLHSFCIPWNFMTRSSMANF